MNPPRTTKRLERLRQPASAPPRADTRPRRSKTPWHGFGPGDWPREEALPQCPSPRCRRARQCISPVNGLYCQRTHFSAEEQALLKPAHPLAKALASVGPLFDPDDLAERMQRVADLAAIRRDYDRAMLAQWQAGLLPARFGPYRPGGVIVAPPPRVYVEQPVQRDGKSAAAARRVKQPSLAIPAQNVHD